MPDGSKVPASLMLPTIQTTVHDFALLKVDKTKLPFLALGDESDIPIGSPITIIGFPLSAGASMKLWSLTL